MIMMHIKHLWQKLTRGYSDADLWNLDAHLAGLILPRLKAFKAMHRNGTPPEMTEEQWESQLDEMIFGLEYVAYEFSGISGFISAKVAEGDAEQGMTDSLRAQRGVESFGRHFGHLWD